MKRSKHILRLDPPKPYHRTARGGNTEALVEKDAGAAQDDFARCLAQYVSYPSPRLYFFYEG